MSIQSTYGLSIVDVTLPTANPILVTAKSSARVIVVRKIIYAPVVYSAAVMTFSDSLTGTVIGTLYVPATAAAGGGLTNAFTLDYGDIGTKLTAGANLLLGFTSGGANGRLHVEAYQRFR